MTSTGPGLAGFLDLVGDEDDDFVLIESVFGLIGMCWSSANRTSPLLGRLAEAADSACAAANRTTRASGYNRFAIILSLVQLLRYARIEGQRRLMVQSNCGHVCGSAGWSRCLAGRWAATAGRDSCAYNNNTIPADTIRCGPVSRSRMRFHIYISHGGGGGDSPSAPPGRDLNLAVRVSVWHNVSPATATPCSRARTNYVTSLTAATRHGIPTAEIWLYRSDTQSVVAVSTGLLSGLLRRYYYYVRAE